jgi:hypothetical protein
MILSLEVVTQPRLGTQAQHGWHTKHMDFVQSHRLRSKKSGTLVAKRSCHKIDNRAYEDAAAEADGQEETMNVLALAQVLHL